jgi:aromatic ring-opening dioxygenase catalytic subunit (LigB family)
MNSPAPLLPTLFISHGGGPCFSMPPQPPLPPNAWDRLGAYLRGLDQSLGERPKAVLVISGHWEEARPTVNTATNPPLLFDYYGFPENTYHLSYPAPGSPAVAAQVRELLQAAGFTPATDSQRGLDHGVFVPFMLIYPEADIPIVQLSLEASLDPARHIAMGQALAPLRQAGVLIVGSGNSYHNLRMMWQSRGDRASELFDTWLTNAAAEREPAKRNQLLVGWQEAPHARDCHPREEHLIPLMVAAGAAGDDTGHRVYADRIMGKAISGFQFG